MGNEWFYLFNYYIIQLNLDVLIQMHFFYSVWNKLMDSKAIGLVFTSALIHATWNVVSKSLKGNTAILVIAHFIGALLNLFLAYLLENDFYQIYRQSSIYYLLIPSILAHGFYVLLLAAAYVYGDVGLVLSLIHISEPTRPY